MAALLFSVMALTAKTASQHLGAAAGVAALSVGWGAVPAAAFFRLSPAAAGSYRALILRGLFGNFAVLTYFLAIAHLPVGIATLLNSARRCLWRCFRSCFCASHLRCARPGAAAHRDRGGPGGPRQCAATRRTALFQGSIL